MTSVVGFALYAAALRLGSVKAEQVLRRFIRGGPSTPPPGLVVVRTVFACDYLAGSDLRRDIHGGSRSWRTALRQGWRP